jgi:hypothetical protein
LHSISLATSLNFHSLKLYSNEVILNFKISEWILELKGAERNVCVYEFSIQEKEFLKRRKREAGGMGVGPAGPTPWPFAKLFAQHVP